MNCINLLQTQFSDKNDPQNIVLRICTDKALIKVGNIGSSYVNAKQKQCYS